MVILNKNYFLLIIVLIISLFVRIIYLKHTLPQIYPDSRSYYKVGRQMIETKIFSDTDRTPLYAIFTNSPRLLNSILKKPSSFNTEMTEIVIIQIIVGLASLILFNSILLTLNISPFISSLFTLFIGLNIFIFGNEVNILTETLATFYLLLVTFLTLKLIDSFSLGRFLSLLFTFFLGILLKPVFLLLPFILLPLIYFAIPTKQVVIGGIIFTLICLSFIKIYTGMNKKYYDYSGISRVSDYNLLGIILKYDLNIESAKNYTWLYQNISQYRQLPYKNSSPFYFLVYYDPLYHHNDELLNTLPDFNRRVILSNFSSYVINSLKETPAAVLEINDIVIRPQPTSPSRNFLVKIYDLYSYLQYLTLLFFPGIILIVWNFIKFKDAPAVKWLVILLIPLYITVSSVFFSYGEYGRLISIALPLIYLTSFKLISLIPVKRFK